MTPVSESSAPVGSSHSRILGFFASALAMETRCCSPPDSSEGNWWMWSERPTSRSMSWLLSGFLAISLTRATFSITVSVGIRL